MKNCTQEENSFRIQRATDKFEAEIEKLLSRRENPRLSNTDKIRLTSEIYRRKTVLRYLKGGKI